MRKAESARERSVKSLKILICLLVWAAPAWAFTPVTSRAVASDQFNISQSTLGGAAPRIIFSDPLREVNHAHVSPDQTRIMFTRYNNCANCGFVTEAADTWAVRPLSAISTAPIV